MIAATSTSEESRPPGRSGSPHGHCYAGRVGVDRQVRQVSDSHTSAGASGSAAARARQILGDPVSDRLIAHMLAEQVDADPLTLREQAGGGGQCFVPGPPGDLARRRPPRLRVPARHRLDDPLKALTRHQSEQHRTINRHDTQPHAGGRHHQLPIALRDTRSSSQACCLRP